MSTKIISAFPGTGKSYYYENSDLNVLDSDSSKFDKQNFPANYIKHIKDNIGKADIIFVSSHEEVRKALVDNDIPFTLVYPDKSLKWEYLVRYKLRGSPENFCGIISNNWDNWISDLQKQKGCDHIILKNNEYIADRL